MYEQFIEFSTTTKQQLIDAKNVGKSNQGSVKEVLHALVIEIIFLRFTARIFGS